MSTAKKRLALELSCKSFIDTHGITNCLFQTWTFADNVVDARDAQKRWNSFSTGYFRKRFPAGYILIKERQKRGSWHYHILTAVSFDVQIDGKWYKRQTKSGKSIWKFRSTNYQLLALWREFRQVREKYGFGREETRPLRVDSVAVSRYLSKYMSKHFRRYANAGEKLIDHKTGEVLCENKRLHLVQYGMGHIPDDCGKAKRDSYGKIIPAWFRSSEKFSWNTKFAKKVRAKVSALALSLFQANPTDWQVKRFQKYGLAEKPHGARDADGVRESLGRHWGFIIFGLASRIIDHCNAVAFNHAVDQSVSLWRYGPGQLLSTFFPTWGHWDPRTTMEFSEVYSYV